MFKAILEGKPIRQTVAIALVFFGFTAVVNARDNLTPQDKMVKTIFDKSIIAGAVEHDAAGNLTFDSKGNVKFNYTGSVHSIQTKGNTGELKEIGDQIGTIEGQAAFPMQFVIMSAAIHAFMNGDITQEQLGQFPPVVPWTCNHCRMVIGDNTYVSIVDALDPVNGSPELIEKFNMMIAGGAAGATEAMRLQARAFTGETPVSFDPVAKTMSLSMAGCSAVVGVSGSDAGMIGTLCLNSTATFDVSGASMDQYGNLTGTVITGRGTSNCTTVLHRPTM